VARRIHKLVRRLLDGEYITCLRNRKQFTQQEMSVAKRYFIRGESMRKIAAREGVTYYRVRQTLKKIQALVEVRSQRLE
jgi:DNA-binding CsgD family transcriptional regulator